MSCPMGDGYGQNCSLRSNHFPPLRKEENGVPSLAARYTCIHGRHVKLGKPCLDDLV